MSRDLQSVVDDFEFLDDWEDKYRYVIELGRELPTFPEAARTRENKVNGCVSQVWLSTSVGDGSDPEITFVGDSDAHIVRGLVALVLLAVSGSKASNIVAFDSEALLTRLGLDSHLSPQRANGLRSMISRIKADANAALAA